MGYKDRDVEGKLGIFEKTTKGFACLPKLHKKLID